MVGVVANVGFANEIAQDIAEGDDAEQTSLFAAFPFFLLCWITDVSKESES